MQAVPKIKKIPDYTPLDIAKSDKFYNSIVKSAGLSDFRHESSFIVHMLDDFRYTKPLQEYDGYCIAGEVGPGVVANKKGYGKALPDGRIQIFAVHYHRTENVLVPTEQDLKVQNVFGYTPTYIEDMLCAVLETEIVGLKGSGLLLFQLNRALDLNSGIIGDIGIKLRNLVFGDGKELNKDPEVPYKAADILRESGLYRAEVVSFSSRREYDKEIKKIKDFELVADFDVEGAANRMLDPTMEEVELSKLERDIDEEFEDQIMEDSGMYPSEGDFEIEE